jgi:DNA-binding beta-propeller fold protein YncE
MFWSVLVREYVGGPPRPYQVAFVPGDPPRLLAVNRLAAYLWEPDRADPVELRWGPGADTPPVTVSPDGRWLAVCMTDVQKCWGLSATPPGPPAELAIPDLLAARLAGTDARLTAVCRSANPDRLLVREVSFGRRSPNDSSPARTVLPVPPELQPQVGTIDPGSWLHAAVLSEDGRRLVLTAREKAAHVWDVRAGGPPRTVALRGFPCGLAFSPDGSRLVIDAGTTLYVHDAATLERLGSWKAKYSYVPGLAWSPDGRLLARTDNSTTVRVFEVATGRQVMAVGGRRGRLGCAAFSPDGLTLATGTHEGPVRVWDME